VSAGLIDSTEMYLRTVLELEEEGIPAIRARLAERLGLSAPSVSEGVARLENEGLVHLADDRTVELTGTGRELATHVLRKHRLAECLLVDVLGLEHEHVHEEACRWEHVISDRVEQKLMDFLGNPRTSPYGNPIPGAGNDDYVVLTLADATTDTVRIERISEQLQSDHELMHGFGPGAISPGDDVEVSRDDGAIVISREDVTMRLDTDKARLLYVSEV
jgi:DtxR family Mn-dependent transcriptional regulator